MRVVLSEQALSDIEAIGEWLEVRDPDAANRLVRALRRSCEDLVESYRQHRLAKELPQPGLRCKLHRPYLIFFTVGKTTLDVLRVIDARRDYAALFANGDARPPPPLSPESSFEPR